MGARPEFTSIESQVSNPRHAVTGARRGFFFAEQDHLGFSNSQYDLARGDSFPDALAGGAAIGAAGAG